MFSATFYPTDNLTALELFGSINFQGKTVWEPEAGKSDLVKMLQERGAEVIACEINPELAKIVKTYCKLIAPDMLTVTSEQISHVDYIIMNPPFNEAAEHIVHAYNIAPAGCKIRALCNTQTLDNTYARKRRELADLIEQHGSREDIGQAFTGAERITNVNASIVELNKPGGTSQEFEGFFIEEDPAEAQYNGLMPYNVVRDLVQRYVESIRIFDEQLETAVRLNELQAGYFDGGLAELSVSFTRADAPVKRADFKKTMQRQGWRFIVDRMGMEKLATRGLREDINKFVEKQTNIPFTMRNIYKMLEIVIGTTGSRMDKALLEVFDKVTAHHHENRHGIEGWQTNSHYLLTKRFIMPRVFDWDKRWPSDTVKVAYDGTYTVEDLTKALCYLTGSNYDTLQTISAHYRDNRIAWGAWIECGFFKIRAFKKGTAHFEFLDEKVWSKFNRHVAALKGYPLPEKKEQTAWQRQRAGEKVTRPTKEFKVMETIKL